MDPVYNTMMVDGREQRQFIGVACRNCGSAQSSDYHYMNCILPFTGMYVDDDDDYYAPKASACVQPSDKAPDASASCQPSDKPTVRIAKNGKIHRVRPEDLHKPKPFRSVSKGAVSKGAVCSNCGAKESVCECWIDVDDSDDETPSAAASNSKPITRFLSSFF